MKHAGTIISTYVVVFGGVGAYCWWMLRRARGLADDVSDEDKPWT